MAEDRLKSPCLSLPSGARSSAESASTADHFSRQRRRSWTRLLKRICEVDPLRCPQYGFAMQIIAFIEQPAVIRKNPSASAALGTPTSFSTSYSFPPKPEAFLASLTPQQAQQIRGSTDSICWDAVPIFRH